MPEFFSPLSSLFFIPAFFMIKFSAFAMNKILTHRLFWNSLTQSFSLLFFIPLLTHCDSGSVQPNTNLNFEFKFDPNQERLNNFGLASTIAADHAAQSPRFNSISAHYIELTPHASTLLGNGVVLFKNEETTKGGATAIDFDKSIKVKEGEKFISIPFSTIPPGTYQYLRVSLSYQNYNIDVLANGINLTGTVASFVGYNTYISTYNVKNSEIVLNTNKKQGYWAFETSFNTSQGQAPEGATTVPNILAATSPIPAGSCVVTGQFSSPLVITGNETADLDIILSLSINKSFEWIEVNQDGKFEPLAGEAVIDMGLRGLIPIIK
jgi:hypothetical protein